MKLIRLSSETSGDFENIFNDTIILEPYSSIGLVSASVPLSNNVVVIGDDNNQFEMNTQISHAMYDVEIQNGSYTTSDFAIELNRAMNTALNNDTETSATCQWRVSLSEDKKLELQLRRGSYDVDVVPANLSPSINLTYDDGPKTYTNSTVGETWNAFGVSTALFTNGAGQIHFTVPAVATKFALGLISEPPASSATTLNYDDYDYVVYTDSAQANYQIAWNKGENTELTTVEQEADSMIIVELSQGSLNLMVSQGGEPTLLKTFPDWSYETHFHLAFNVLSAGGVVEDLQWQPDPFGSNVSGDYLYPANQPNLIYDSEALTTPPSTAKATISFKTKKETGKYLGFEKQGYENPVSSLTWDVKAEESLTQSLDFTDMMVEIPSLTMESYDGSLNKRRPIIAYIPSLEILNNELTYSAVNPIMIDINNANPILLNRIQIRILSSNPEGVNFEGASIVVIIGKK